MVPEANIALVHGELGGFGYGNPRLRRSTRRGQALRVFAQIPNPRECMYLQRTETQREGEGGAIVVENGECTDGPQDASAAR